MRISISALREMRQNKGWSQELLAKTSGLSLRTIQRIEATGQSSPESVLALSSALEVPPGELHSPDSDADINWTGEKIMKAIFILLIGAASIVTLMSFGGSIGHYYDWPSLLFCLLFVSVTTALSFGFNGLVKSIKGFKYLFSEDTIGGEPARYLSTIYQKQIGSCYAAALIASIIGINAVIRHAHSIGAIGIDTLLALAINLLVFLYAAIIAEGVLRPLKNKLETG